MILRWRVVPLRVPWMRSRRSGVNARTAFAVLSLASFLPAVLAHGELSTGSLGRYRPYSVRDVGDRVFFTCIPEPGKLHEFNIYESREGTDSPRPLLTPAEAARYRLHDTFIVRPGARVSCPRGVSQGRPGCGPALLVRSLRGRYVFSVLSGGLRFAPTPGYSLACLRHA